MVMVVMKRIVVSSNSKLDTLNVTNGIHNCSDIGSGRGQLCPQQNKITKIITVKN